MKPRVAVIGAGWAGCAAAVHLAADTSIELTLFEAGRVAGGRARRLELSGQRLDNGQHILLGAYHHCLRLMRTVGVDPEQALWRHPLRLEMMGGMTLALPRLPAPWHLVWGLARMRGVDWRTRASLLRACLNLAHVPVGCTVAEWLATQRQSLRLQAEFWIPLTLAALNTPPEQADMQVLATVLRDSLAGRASDSDLLLPRVDLSALFPEPALAWLTAQGHRVQLAQRVRSITPEVNQVWVDGQAFDAVIVAVAPQHVAALLPDLAFPALNYQPIYTVYLHFESPANLPFPMLGLGPGMAQWVFDRGQLDAAQQGWLAVVISGPGPHQGLSHAELAHTVEQELRCLWPQLARCVEHQVVAERRATFSCDAGLVRPRMQTPWSRVLLAGDAVAGAYPATLEGAVRSGIVAAEAASVLTSRYTMQYESTF